MFSSSGPWTFRYPTPLIKKFFFKKISTAFGKLWHILFSYFSCFSMRTGIYCSAYYESLKPLWNTALWGNLGKIWCPDNRNRTVNFQLAFIPTKTLLWHINSVIFVVFTSWILFSRKLLSRPALFIALWKTLEKFSRGNKTKVLMVGNLVKMETFFLINYS